MTDSEQFIRQLASFKLVTQISSKVFNQPVWMVISDNDRTGLTVTQKHLTLQEALTRADDKGFARHTIAVEFATREKRQ